jgi:hypothetical protein
VATLTVQAAIYPSQVPDPVPLPISAAALSIGCRLAIAGVGGDDPLAGRLVQEVIGNYSYRLADPTGFETAFALTPAEEKLLEPYLHGGSVYDVATYPPLTQWPVNWWQSNYDDPWLWLDAAQAGTVLGFPAPPVEGTP